MRRHIFLLLFFITILLFSSGRIFAFHGAVSLIGEWRMMRGDDIRYSQPGFNDYNWPVITLPSKNLMPDQTSHLIFPYYSVDPQKDISGFAWFRKNFILHQRPQQDLMIQIREIMNADRIYINGNLVGSTGKFPPGFRSGWSKFRSYQIPAKYLKQGDNLVAIQMYFDAESWILKPMEIVSLKAGKPRQLQYDFFLNHLIEAFCVLLLFNVLFFLFFFIRRSKEREYLYFSFANGCLIIALLLHFFETTYGLLPISSNNFFVFTQSGLLFFALFFSFFYKQYVEHRISKQRFICSLSMPSTGIILMLLGDNRGEILFWRNIFLVTLLIFFIDLFLQFFTHLKQGKKKIVVPMMIGMIPSVFLGTFDIFSFAFRIFESGIATYVYGFPIMLLVISAHLISRFIKSLNEAEKHNIMLQQYQTIFENATDGIFQAEANGNILAANPAALHILKAESPEDIDLFPTKQIDDIIVDPGKRIELMNLLSKNNVVRDFECGCYRNDGSQTTVSLSVQAVRDENQNLLFYEGILKDIAQKKINEKLLIEKKSAEQANQAKSEFLANMSHELRTPMQGILGFAKLGIDKVNILSPEKCSSYFSQIYTSGRRLLNLLNDLLDLSKLEAGKADYFFNEIYIIDLIDELLSEFESTVQEKKISIDIIRPNKNRKAEVDKNKMLQVLRNIVSNAIKFSGNNSSIRLEVDNQQDYALTSVFDNGVGIPKEEMDSVFDKFVQSNRTKNGSGGTGLGLSICKRIVEDHCGSIWAENNPAGGAVFRFSIPYRQARKIRVPSEE